MKEGGGSRIVQRKKSNWDAHEIKPGQCNGEFLREWCLTVFSDRVKIPGHFYPCLAQLCMWAPGNVRAPMSWDLQLRQALQQLTTGSLQLGSKSSLEWFFLCIVPCRALLEAEAKEKLRNTHPIFILNVSIWYIMHSAFILIFKTIALTYLSWLPNFFDTPHPYILPPYSQLSSSTTFFRERDEKELHFLPCAFSSRGYTVFQKLSI